jgi:hypothetical protein
MKYFKSKKYLIFSGIALLSLLCVQPSLAGNQILSSFSEETLVSDSELSVQSGQGVDGSVIRSNAQLTNNVINVGSGASVTNGNNIVSDHAFSGVDGIPTVVQNSGNNVIIQNSTIVNMSFQ